MENFFMLILSSTIIMAGLHLIYILFLKRVTFHSFNRLYLLLILFLSFLLPFIPNISQKEISQIPQLVYDFSSLNRELFDPAGINKTDNIIFNPRLIFYFLYLIIVSFLILRLFIRILQLIFLIKKSAIKKIGYLNIVLVDKNITPFSFFNYIFLNSNSIKKKPIKHILLHEKEHIIKLHSFDKIFLEIITAFFWINPFIWLIKKSLNEIHEYQADKGVIYNGYTNSNYIKLMVNQAFGNQFFQLTNNFNYSLIKKRMLMMTKTKSPVIKKLNFLLIIPACIGLFLLLSFTNIKPMYFSGLNSKPNIVTGNKAKDFDFPLDLEKAVKVTARFGDTIFFQGEKIVHKGIDIKALTGTKVYAACDGKVSFVENSEKGFGNQIIIDHSYLLQTRYAHLDNILVKQDQLIKKGDVIGTVGNTGKSTGPHLHFEVIKNGKSVNPEDYIKLIVK